MLNLNRNEPRDGDSDANADFGTKIDTDHETNNPMVENEVNNMSKRKQNVAVVDGIQIQC